MTVPTLSEKTSPASHAWAATDSRLAAQPSPGIDLPHVVAWNLTRRCNLACAHCYISAGSWEVAETELSTEACLDIVDQILDVNPAPMLILSGGEPLLRDDLEIIASRASTGGATVVVGTNGTRLTDERIRSLMDAGVTGVAVSIDSLDPTFHDRFRMAASQAGGVAERVHGTGALADTMAAVERLRSHGLDFVIQTSLTPANRSEIARIAEWSAEQGAVSLNVYFLVATGRGEGVRALTPDENEAALVELADLEETYRGRMMIRSKCQPQIMRHVIERDSESPLLSYKTRCPCGVQYLRITPEGQVTPCPYTPLVAGDLTQTSFRTIWEESEVFAQIRSGDVGGKCGSCEYREVCGGCRARAYAEGNGIMGADDSCAYEPDGSRPVIPAAASITYGAAAELELDWTPEALERVRRIPSFVRGVVTSRVEEFARKRGRHVIDLDTMAEVRSTMPVDFSKRLPFFLRREMDNSTHEGDA